MRNRIHAWAVASTAVFLLASAPAFSNSPVKEGDALGKPAPSFEISDLAGGKFSSASILKQGKGIVVNFWGLRCSACIEELPHLAALQAKYNGKVDVIAVNVDGIDAATLKGQMERKKLDLKCVVAPDPDFKMVDAFNMLAAPLTVVIDPQGVVRYRHENYVPGDEVALDAAVAKAVSGAK